MSADTRNRGIALALAALLAAVTPAVAENHYDRGNTQGNQMVLHAQPQDAVQIAAQHGLQISGSHLSEDGYMALLEAPASLTAEQIEGLLQGDPRVADLSRVELAALPETGGVMLAQGDVATDLSKAGDFTTACLSQGFGGLLWSGYADQEAVGQISLHEAHLATGHCGVAVVAILDTGVDPDHPLLQGALVPGYDFILEQSGMPSEWSGLEQSVSAILEQSVSAILEQSVSAILEGEGEILTLGSLGPVLAQSVSAILEEDSPPPFFGHGTMVAGLVRLTAPTAKIMPLRVFQSSGSAHVFDVVRAIYHAVDHGADVISMSFSMEDSSTELRNAVKYANRHGVVCVAAAGNGGEQTTVYPAAYSETLGVAALDGEALSPFSNSGAHMISVAAPGSGVISAYPGGLYGAGWGTSFSAPLVSGTIALLRHLYPKAASSAVTSMENALRKGSAGLPDQAGFGALDVLGVVLEAQ